MVITTAFPNVTDSLCTPNFICAMRVMLSTKKAAGKPLSATTQNHRTVCVSRPHDCERVARTLFRSPRPSAPHSCPITWSFLATLRNIMLGSSGKRGSMRDWLRVRVPGISYSLASHSSFFKEITWDHTTIQLPCTRYLLGAKWALQFTFSCPPLCFLF